MITAGETRDGIPVAECGTVGRWLNLLSCHGGQRVQDDDASKVTGAEAGQMGPAQPSLARRMLRGRHLCARSWILGVLSLRKGQPRTKALMQVGSSAWVPLVVRWDSGYRPRPGAADQVDKLGSGSVAALSLLCAKFHVRAGGVMCRR